MNQPATGAFTEYQLTLQLFGAAMCESRLPLSTIMIMAKRQVIMHSLRAHGENQHVTAKALGMHRNSLIRAKNMLNITPELVTCDACGKQTGMRYSRDYSEVWPRTHNNQRGKRCPGAYRPCKKPAASEPGLNQEKQA